MIRAGEFGGDVGSGQWSKAAKTIPALASLYVGYMIMPSLIEDLVAQDLEGPDEYTPWGFTKWLGYMNARSLAAPVIGGRDIANALLRGHRPEFGLFNTMGAEAMQPLKDAYDAYKDYFDESGKTRILNSKGAARMVRDSLDALSLITRLSNHQTSKAAKASLDYYLGNIQPEDPVDTAAALVAGKLDKNPGWLRATLKRELGYE
jgi:hypothetical protein